MSKPVLGDDPFATDSEAATAAGEEKGRTRRRTRDRPKPRSQAAPASGAADPGVARTPLPTLDGASARRASRTTYSIGDRELAAVEPAPRRGRGLDPEEDQRPPTTGSLSGELHRIEQHVVHRIRGEVEPARARGGVGRMLALDTYRGWLASVKMRTRSDVVDDFGLDPVYAERWRPLLDFLYQSYWRVETQGMENLPDHGRALIVANHSGTLPYDGAMIMYAVRFFHPAHRDVRPLVEDFVFHFPFLGVALNRIGCVRACQENAERLLSNEQVVAVFPEGIKGISKLYKNRYQLQRFGRGGFVKLALKCRAPVIPTSVVGAEEIHPMLWKVTWLAKYLGIPYIPITPTFPWLGLAGALPIPSKWTIRFGEPIDLASQYGPGAGKDRILVNRLAEQVRTTIQTMVDETLLTRRSIVFG